jgi:hypothetical protein
MYAKGAGKQDAYENMWAEEREVKRGIERLYNDGVHMMCTPHKILFG